MRAIHGVQHCHHVVAQRRTGALLFIFDQMSQRTDGVQRVWDKVNPTNQRGLASDTMCIDLMVRRVERCWQPGLSDPVELRISLVDPQQDS